MRNLIFTLIISLFGIIGYEVKRKYIEQQKALQALIEFINYLHVNIKVYKNNLCEIIDNYLIMQKNKNAKYVNIFIKNNNIIQINEKLLNNYIFNADVRYNIISYFKEFGRSELSDECVKSKHIINLLESEVVKTREEIKSKGDLYFKCILAFGVVLVIVLW